ncbi:DsbA family oxidoreductase [Mongoliitalea daihaiensis]|uniref:DsbA family oxidoreductase n=1 Tax=Mongoliitalea daihaiensis TaxID=2782006 RepID=UPI001F225AE1|nr:DsbA family oxidoreductase [Mongoliitalea daihaiensis]UJP64226.1 DsbA family oxidoreductase [Mongoliitalea daihaiensis]
MKIEIWSDIMCPFCYIGKRRLEKALESFEYRDQIVIEWKSFLLNPTMKTDPNKNSLEYLSEVKGWSMDQTKEITAQVVQMAAAEGLDYDMEHAVVANAYKAHRLLHFAKTHGLGSPMKERLLRAYFTEGMNIDDSETLITLAVEIGLPQEAVYACLNSDAFLKEVNEDVQEAQQLGVRGVPFFVLDRKFGISGAQQDEVFQQTIAKAFAGYQASMGISFLDGGGQACDVEGNCN